MGDVLVPDTHCLSIGGGGEEQEMPSRFCHLKGTLGDAMAMSRSCRIKVLMLRCTREFLHCQSAPVFGRACRFCRG